MAIDDLGRSHAFSFSTPEAEGVVMRTGVEDGPYRPDDWRTVRHCRCPLHSYSRGLRKSLIFDSRDGHTDKMCNILNDFTMIFVWTIIF